MTPDTSELFRELASDRSTVCGTCQRIRRLKVGSQRNLQRHDELIFQLLYLEDTSSGLCAARAVQCSRTS